MIDSTSAPDELHRLAMTYAKASLLVWEEGNRIALGVACWDARKAQEKARDEFRAAIARTAS